MKCFADKLGIKGLIGALRDDADLLDQAVAHAMKVREAGGASRHGPEDEIE